MPARLVPLAHGSAPIISLHRPVSLVGRHPECDIRLDLPPVSRRHCCLALAYDRLTIRDLGSLHGVWVNGERVEEARLHPGDEIAIASLLFRYEETDPPASKAASRPKPTSGSRDDEDNDLMPLSDDIFPAM